MSLGSGVVSGVKWLTGCMGWWVWIGDQGVICSGNSIVMGFKG